MIRSAFTLRLEQGALPRYQEHHDNIWPELVSEIERCGIGTMSAFITDPTVFYKFHAPFPCRKPVTPVCLHRRAGQAWVL